jgi:hypothetical protein
MTMMTDGQSQETNETKRNGQEFEEEDDQG